MVVNMFKYSNITLFILLLNYAVAVKSAVVTPNKCTGKNFIYKECGSACPKTCLNKDKILPCTDQCVSGCFCIDGYVLNEMKQCILPQQCPKACTELNTEYKSNGPQKPKTCSTRYSNLPVGGKGVPGCFCKPGFILNVLKECIPIEKCDACGFHEYYSNCKNYPCRDTCAGNWSTTCFFSQGCYPGCACEDGYIRNDQNICVLRANCPNAGGTSLPYDTELQDGECSGKNEFYSSCGPCESSCSNRNPICTDQCRAGCFCKPGFVRKDGVCVPPSACRVTRSVNGFSTGVDDGECSGKNEHYTECGTCDPTCEEPAPMCTQQCRIGCFCLAGFVRNNGNCILPSECPNKCGKNEEYKTCGTCERTCESLNPKCTNACRKGCFCKEGYARHIGRCIPVASCRPFIITTK